MFGKAFPAREVVLPLGKASPSLLPTSVSLLVGSGSCLSELPSSSDDSLDKLQTLLSLHAVSSLETP